MRTKDELIGMAVLLGASVLSLLIIHLVLVLKGVH